MSINKILNRPREFLNFDFYREVQTYLYYYQMTFDFIAIFSGVDSGGAAGDAWGSE